jgi:hypothetical protein
VIKENVKHCDGDNDRRRKVKQFREDDDRDI